MYVCMYPIIFGIMLCVSETYIQEDTEKRELLKNPTKIEEIQEKK